MLRLQYTCQHELVDNVTFAFHLSPCSSNSSSISPAIRRLRNRFPSATHSEVFSVIRLNTHANKFLIKIYHRQATTFAHIHSTLAIYSVRDSFVRFTNV